MVHLTFRVLKRVGQSFLYLKKYSLILADNIVIYLSFAIIYGNLLKYITVTVPLLQRKLVHTTTLSQTYQEII